MIQIIKKHSITFGACIGAIIGGLWGWIDSATVSLTFWGSVAGAGIGGTVGLNYLPVQQLDDSKLEKKTCVKVEAEHKVVSEEIPHTKIVVTVNLDESVASLKPRRASCT